jgi:hypothetical protein
MTLAETELDRRYHWVPLDPQRQVLKAIHDMPDNHWLMLGYGGAAGGGKTNLLAQLALQVSLEWPGARTLVGRDSLVDLKTTTLAEFDSIVPPELLFKRYDSSPVFREIRHPDWPEGTISTVFFRQIHDAEHGIGSEQYGWVLVEEGHECRGPDIRYLFSRMRHKPETKRGMVVAFNPFPSYVSDVFLDGSEAPPEVKLEDGTNVLDVRHIPSRIQDNTHLPPGYEAMLRSQYANDPYYLAVLLEGRSGVVPKAIYGSLHDPLTQQLLRFDALPETTRLVRMVTGWDWGTSQSHKSAGVLLAVDAEGYLWMLDTWESPSGSKNELLAVAEGWVARANELRLPITAAYDGSQASLADDLDPLFAHVVKGVRDVEGRIRTGRGLIATYRCRFIWGNYSNRDAWRYLGEYHRDDDDKIVEVRDDMVDAWHYAIYEAEHSSYEGYAQPTATAARYRPSQPGRREAKTRA